MTPNHQSAAARRPFAWVAALAAVSIGAASAQCLPADQVTPTQSGGTQYTASTTVAGSTTPVDKQVCVVLACPVPQHSVHLESASITWAPSMPTKALTSVNWKPHDAWVALPITMQANAAVTALIAQPGGMLGAALGNEARIEFNFRTGTGSTEVSVVMECATAPAEAGEDVSFPVREYVICAHAIPVGVLIIILLTMLLGRCNSKVRAQFVEWGWCGGSDARSGFAHIKDRAGGAMWYDHATEVVNEFNQEKIYETAARDENQNLEDLGDDTAVETLL